MSKKSLNLQTETHIDNTESVNVINSNPLDIFSIVTKVQDAIENEHIMCNHIANGTMDQYLDYVANEFIFDMTTLSTRCNNEGIELDESPTTVTSGFMQVADLLTHYFCKDPSFIETLLIDKMNKYPVDDVREACSLRHKGMLH